MPSFDWPIEMRRPHPIGWMAVLALVADAVVDRVWQSRRTRPGPMTSSGFILGVDLDGVCGDYTAACADVVIERTGADPASLPLERSWDFREWGLSRRPVRGDAPAAVLEHRIFRTMPPIPGAAETLWRLSDAGVWIRIITHRLYVNWGHAMAVADTVEWLDATGIPYRDLCFLGAKPQVEADCYVEDAPHNVEALRETGSHVIVFDQPYNRGVPGPRAPTGRGRDPGRRPGGREGPVAAGAAAGVRGRAQPAAAGPARTGPTTPALRGGGLIDWSDLAGAVVVVAVFSVPLALTGWALLDAARRPSGSGRWPAGGGWRGWPPSCSGRWSVVVGLVVSTVYLVRVGPELAAVERAGSAGRSKPAPRRAGSGRPVRPEQLAPAAGRSGPAGGGRWRGPGPGRPVRAPAGGHHRPGGQLPQGDGQADAGVVAARVLAHHEQGVAQLEVVDHRGPGPDVHVADLGAPHDPDLPAGGLGPDGQLGLLAVGEVALVEQPHVLQAPAGGQHERPVGIAGRLPALGDGGGGRDGAEVAVDDRGQAVADVGGRQPGPGLGLAGGHQAGEASGQGPGVVGAHRQPVGGVVGQEPAEPGVGTRPEPGVGAQLEDVDGGRQAADRGQPVRPRAVVDHHDAGAGPGPGTGRRCRAGRAPGRGARSRGRRRRPRAHHGAAPARPGANQPAPLMIQIC